LDSRNTAKPSGPYSRPTPDPDGTSSCFRCSRRRITAVMTRLVQGKVVERQHGEVGDHPAQDWSGVR
jgi:hypothetical protein